MDPRSTEVSPAKRSSKGRAGTIVKKKSTAKVARADRENSDIFDVPKFYMPVQLAERDEMVEFEEDEDEQRDQQREQQSITNVIDKLRRQKAEEEHVKLKRLAMRRGGKGRGKPKDGDTSEMYGSLGIVHKSFKRNLNVANLPGLQGVTPASNVPAEYTFTNAKKEKENKKKLRA